jgi:predicted small lipoprotein YifL
MTPHARVALFAALIAVAVSGCGQTGPLELPENAGPIERVEPPAQPEPPPTDDERQDER